MPATNKRQIHGKHTIFLLIGQYFRDCISKDEFALVPMITHSIYHITLDPLIFVLSTNTFLVLIYVLLHVKILLQLQLNHIHLNLFVETLFNLLQQQENNLHFTTCN